MWRDKRQGLWVLLHPSKTCFWPPCWRETDPLLLSCWCGTAATLLPALHCSVKFLLPASCLLPYYLVLMAAIQCWHG